MLQTQHSERVTAPHEEYCMTRAHLSPYRDASKQVADKLRFFRGASPGTPPSVCARELVSLCWKTNRCQSYFVLQSESVCSCTTTKSTETFVSPNWPPRQVCFLKITFLRRQTCFTWELIFFGETSQHTWDNKCHLTSVMFVLIIVRLILELHDAAGSGFFYFDPHQIVPDHRYQKPKYA